MIIVLLTNIQLLSIIWTNFSLYFGKKSWDVKHKKVGKVPRPLLIMTDDLTLNCDSSLQADNEIHILALSWKDKQYAIWIKTWRFYLKFPVRREFVSFTLQAANENLINNLFMIIYFYSTMVQVSRLSAWRSPKVSNFTTFLIVQSEFKFPGNIALSQSNWFEFLAAFTSYLKSQTVDKYGIDGDSAIVCVEAFTYLCFVGPLPPFQISISTIIWETLILRVSWDKNASSFYHRTK